MNRGPGNPLALGLVIVGAAAMALAAFLPLDEPNGVFRMVAHNTLIQHGGWTLIALAIGIAATGFQANQRRGNWLAYPIVLCVLAGFRVVDLAMDKDSRTLYPVKLDGTVDTSKPGTVAPLGIALYVAGAAVAIALIGSVMLRQAEKSGASQAVNGPTAVQAPTKKCPDCAETILADAKVCKHCGYRFPSTNLRCNKCQHVQAVPQGQLSFVCDGCGTKLKRQPAKLKRQPAKGS
jgi:hypothetical protein